jgi:hypothetical protein
MRKKVRGLILVFFLGIACMAHWEGRVSAMADPQSANSPQLLKFLTDQNIWGPDAVEVFAYLDRWKSEGEATIEIFADRVVSGNKFETAAQGKERAARLSQAMKRPGARLAPELAAAFKAGLAKKTPPSEIESARFLEDDSYRLTWRREGAEFLKRDLTMRAVTSAYGAPEKTSTEVVQARGDRRPAVLTISEYDGGKIKFIQSDLSPDPSLIDRVILDVRAAAAVALASH